MEGPTDKEILKDRRLVPRNPFEVEATKSILLKHIEAGDITEQDIELMKNSYRTVTLVSFLGSALAGGGSYFYMKRRSPNLRLGPRLMVAGGLGMVGSFLGFTVAGAAMAMDISNKMEDPERKMQIMADIAVESKRAIAESRSGRTPFPFPPQGQSPAGSASTSRRAYDTPPTDSRWDAEGDRERIEEQDRENGLRNEIGRIEGDSSNEQRPPTAGKIVEGVKKETGSVWDKIRADRPVSISMPSVEAAGGRGGDVGVGGGARADTRSKEQRDFDALLEKERSGVDAEETWK